MKDLQWAGNDVEGAKALLDEAGIVDNDGDGWREWNGEKISLQAVCPQGWTDWNASMEIVAAAGQNIGVDITTYLALRRAGFSAITGIFMLNQAVGMVAHTP